ncbi:MAG TPA: hypothetical protein VK633_13310 [Verrucomicrobiae bacterium]|nr:hypothetical protein [Verrucomicrobiae bacterium]
MPPVGKLYGSFVVEGSLPESSETVLLVRHRADSAASGGVVKKVVLPRSDSLLPGVMAVRRLDAIALQDRVAADWPEVAPVLDRPTTREQLRDVLNAGEAWYVTPRYDLSVQKFLSERGGQPVEAAAIWLICRRVIRGALAFQQVDPGTGRRSHGNLKLSNILMKGLPPAKDFEVVVTDPAPGGRTDQTPEEREQLLPDFEKLDLEAVGQMLFQLVAGRAFIESTDWNRIWETPEASVKRWKKVFGPDAKAWMELCREMLEVRRSTHPLRLATVEKRLADLPPKEQKVKPTALLVAGAALLLAGVLAVLYARRATAAELTVSVPLEDVQVVLRSQQPGGAKLRLSRESKAGVRPVLFLASAEPGSYLLEVTPVGAFAHLPAISTNLQLNAQGSYSLAVDIPFAQVSLKSAPSGSQVFWRSGAQQKRLGVTPLEIKLPPDDRYEESEFQFVTDGYARKTVLTQLTAGTNLLLMATLAKQQVGSITADFRSDVDQGRFRKTRFFVNDEEKTSEIVELTPETPFALTIVPPRPWAEVNTNLTFGSEPLHHTFVYSPGYGTLVLSYKDVDIRTATVWLRDENQELKLGAVANEIFRLPGGRYSLGLELEGYSPTNFPVLISNSKTTLVPVSMEKLAGR